MAEGVRRTRKNSLKGDIDLSCNETVRPQLRRGAPARLWAGPGPFSRPRARRLDSPSMGISRLAPYTALLYSYTAPLSPADL
jgi:hypothetical protein